MRKCRKLPVGNQPLFCKIGIALCAATALNYWHGVIHSTLGHCSCVLYWNGLAFPRYSSFARVGPKPTTLCRYIYSPVQPTCPAIVMSARVSKPVSTNDFSCLGLNHEYDTLKITLEETETFDTQGYPILRVQLGRTRPSHHLQVIPCTHSLFGLRIVPCISSDLKAFQLQYDLLTGSPVYG